MLRASALALALAVATPGIVYAQDYDTGRATGAEQTIRYSIIDIQQALAQAGYDPGPIDGTLGPTTRRAISSFQRDYGLAVTGTPTSGLFRTLEEQGYLYAGRGPGGPGDRRAVQAARQAFGYPVASIEQALAQAGYSPGSVDGVLDTRDRRAIESFQQDFGLPVTGTPTRSLITALEENGYLTAQDQAMAQDGAAPSPDLVADIQSALQRQGYEVGGSTGDLNPQTRAAIRAFQRQQGLPATGQPPPALRALNDGAAGPGSTAAAPAELTRAELVREVERRLQNKGYDVGPVNDVVEPKTAQAIRRYQEERGFMPTGTVSPRLLADLEESDVRAGEQAQFPTTPEEAAGELFRGLGERAIEGLQGR